MAAQKKKSKRDIEKNYPVKQFVKKLRRLADCIEQGQKFQIQVAGERISIPAAAITATPKISPASTRANASGRC